MIRTNGTVIHRGNATDLAKRRSCERYESRVPALTFAIFLFQDSSLLYLFIKLRVLRR